MTKGKARNQQVTDVNQNPQRKLGLRVGDWVWVCSKDEILATLDSAGRLDGLPFQPEMLAFCGRRLRVAKVAHKTCDTINKTGGRRMLDAVHLEGARCDGSLHGGCQADCVFFWKEAWLRRQDTPEVAIAPAVCTEDALRRSVQTADTAGTADPPWVCQTTKLFEATSPLAWWDVRQYVMDVASGNHGIWEMTKLLLFAGYRSIVRLGIGYRALVGLYNGFQKLRGGNPYPEVAGKIPDGKPTPAASLGLEVGDLVEVRSAEEIASTITSSGFNRGMRFDMEMLAYSGRRYRVQMRVDRLINENTGKMMEMKTPCIQLADVYCRARCTPGRLGCPRASNTYWREIWLRRVSQ